MTAQPVERDVVMPAYSWTPPRHGSMVEQVARVCASVGRVLDEEQRHAVDVLTSVKADGTPATLEGAVIVARQNLKTFILEGIALTKLLEPDSPIRLGVWSAHEFDTTQESFRNFDELIDANPHISRRVKRVMRGNGDEQIEFVGGRRMKFKARTRSGGRGLTGDFVILDEAFALKPAHMGALLPVLSTRRRAHVLYGSSAGQMDSAILRSIRDRGRKGGAGAPAYVEWCAPGSLGHPGCTAPGCLHEPGTAGCVLDREDYWLLANPAMDRRITREYLRTERHALPAEEFARERLGWWDEPGGEAPFTVADWDACADPESTADGAPVFGVDASWGLRSVCIVAATRAKNGKVHLEVVEHRAGSDWVVDRLDELIKAHSGSQVVMHRTAPVAGLLADVLARGIEPVLMTDAQMGQACGGVQVAVTADRPTLEHLGDPILSTALAVASRRDIGDGSWVWTRKNSAGDISPVVAATKAHWGLQSTPKPAQSLVAWR